MQWKSSILTNQASRIDLNLSELIQKDLDCNLGTRNTVWRRLRRAKKGLLIKNKFMENWIAPAYMGLICGFGQKRGLYAVCLICGLKKPIYTLEIRMG